MSFAQEVENAVPKTIRCRTCIVLLDMEPKDRAEVQEFLLENPDKARRAAMALKARGASVSETSVRTHCRERHEL